MTRYAVLMVLVLVGGVMADDTPSNSGAPQFAAFGFSLLDITSFSFPPPADTAWLHLESRYNRGPLVDPVGAPLSGEPATLRINWPVRDAVCVCERCPVLYGGDYCPLCGRYVPDPHEPFTGSGD